MARSGIPHDDLGTDATLSHASARARRRAGRRLPSLAATAHAAPLRGTPLDDRLSGTPAPDDDPRRRRRRRAVRARRRGPAARGGAGGDDTDGDRATRRRAADTISGGAGATGDGGPTSGDRADTLRAAPTACPGAPGET